MANDRQAAPDHYSRWNDPEIVERFASKTADDFFASEIRLLAPIARQIESVIDIGCASGRFIELLHRLGTAPSYTGIDLSAASIARARALYPEHAFHCTNALDFALGGQADLVNATGVMQHEPRFAELIRLMLAWSRRFVLFDVKLGDTPAHVIDIETSYVESEPRLYFVVLSPQQLIDELSSMAGIRRIKLYAYATTPNRRVHLPATVGAIRSAGVLLEKGNRDAASEIVLTGLDDIGARPET